MKKGGWLALGYVVLWALVVVCCLAAPALAQDRAGEMNKLMEQAARAQAGETVYDAVLAGKSCREDESTQALVCEYKAGTGLHILIEGLGQPDTGITFLKSSADGDFFGSFAILHGCVIVARGQKGVIAANGADFAFVSPKNGKVYKSWEECKEGW